MSNQTSTLDQEKTDQDVVTCPGCGSVYAAEGAGKVQCEQCGICVTC